MLRYILSQQWDQIQSTLFPWIVEEIGEISEKQQQLINMNKSELISAIAES